MRGMLPALMAVRRMLPALGEVALRRDVAEFDAIAEREARTRGSDPVCAGGAAERAGRMH